MRAAYYESVGPALDVIRVGERPASLSQVGEVLIRLQGSGVNPSNVNARAGARGARWQLRRVCLPALGAGAIGARFALADTAKAHVAVESGSVIGNVVVTFN